MIANLKNYLVTGGAGFIGSSFVSRQVKQGNKIIVLDKLTYAGKKENLSWIKSDNYKLIEGDILDETLVREILEKHNIEAIVHFAAESHVDNSIKNPDAFITTNINGTHSLLKCALEQQNKNSLFHFHHISTDEVFGDLEIDAKDKFNENTPYNPSSPYSASKAASDHLVRAYYKTYNLNITISNCSNNYGPRQHQEKLIPTIINKANLGQKIPIYGNGINIRDWVHVDDHNYGVDLILTKGQKGQTYCIGGNQELNNNQVVAIICELFDKIKPKKDGESYKNQIIYVKDRAGHDKRYAIDNKKISSELGFKTKINFEEGIEKLIKEAIKKDV